MSNLLISSSYASRSSLYTSHSLTMWVLLSIVVPHGHICVATSSSRLLEYLFLLSGRSRSPTRNRSFAFSRSALGCADTFPYQHIPSTRRVSLSASPLSPYFLALAFPFLLRTLSFTSVLYPPNFSIDSTSSWSPPKSFHIFSTTLSHLIPVRPFVDIWGGGAGRCWLY